MRKRGLKEVRPLAQGHTAQRGQRGRCGDKAQQYSTSMPGTQQVPNKRHREAPRVEGAEAGRCPGGDGRSYRAVGQHSWGRGGEGSSSPCDGDGQAWPWGPPRDVFIRNEGNVPTVRGQGPEEAPKVYGAPGKPALLVCLSWTNPPFHLCLETAQCGVQDPGSDVSLVPGSALCLLCDLKQVMSHLQTSVSPSARWSHRPLAWDNFLKTQILDSEQLGSESWLNLLLAVPPQGLLFSIC